MASKTPTLTPKRSGRVAGGLLPEVIEQILSRLPSQRLLNFRYVCKLWHILIAEPYFLKLHSIKSSFHLNPTHLLICSPTPEKPFDLHYVPLETISRAMHLKNLPFKSQDRSMKLTIVGSCNGFVCLSNFLDSLWLCNPLTGDWVKLPTTGVRLRLGFGYSAKGNVYKVIRIMDIKVNVPYGDFRVEVLTVGSDSWREVGAVNWKIGTGFSDGPIYLNGYLHWFTYDLVFVVDGIQAFDIGDYKIGVIPLPNFMRDGISFFDVKLGVLGGCLMIAYYSEQDLQVWIMKDHGAGKVWNMEFRIPGSRVATSYLVPMGVQNNGNVVLASYDRLVSYDPRTRTLEHLNVPGLPNNFKAFPHVATLFTLLQALPMEGL